MSDEYWAQDQSRQSMFRITIAAAAMAVLIAPAGAQTRPGGPLVIEAPREAHGFQQPRRAAPRAMRAPAPAPRYAVPPQGMGPRYSVNGRPVYVAPAAPAGRGYYSGSAGHHRLVVPPNDPRVQRPAPRPRAAAPAPLRSVARRTVDPAFQRTEVDYSGNHAPGTVVVDTSTRYLYLVLENGRALRYGVGVGRDGFQWKGTHKVTAKREWPDWRPPAEMLQRQPNLPRHMKGGPDNPLGARALYLGSTLYRIHGSNEPWTIGQAVSSGCFRMTNEDVTDLYERVPVGAQVVVL